MAQIPRFFGLMTVICYCVISASAKECNAPRWFGEDCKYKCHCDPFKSCRKDGSCSKCAKGWFGPFCQFVDLVTTGQMTPDLAKTKEGKCSSSKEWIRIKWDNMIFFTWLRLKFDEDIRDMNDIKIRLKETNYYDGTGKTIMECVNQKSSLVDSKTVDIHCDMDVAISQVNISGPQLKSLCAVHISGGRNIALKQQTEQTSLYRHYRSHLAVDGDIDMDFEAGSCTHTTYDSKLYWKVTFPSYSWIYKYNLYNRYGFIKRLQGFTLEALDSNNKVVFKYTDAQDEALLIYNIRATSIKPKIKHVKISLPQDGNKLLTLCEVEVFGDQECPTGFYGLQCNEKCHCHVKEEQCYFHTGVCPSGCAPGFHQDGCKKGCDDHKWGVNCLQACDYRCQGDECNAVDGRCVNGCRAGYLGPRCNIACKNGFYGNGCTSVCPLNCDDEPCDIVTGDCFGCKIGYTGDRCDQEITTTTQAPG